MNSTSACGFSSLNDVLAQADAGQINITNLVQSCPDTCTLVWGTGNPDLSGIGANISYIMQVIFIVLFGPLYVLIYDASDRLKLRKKVVKNLDTLHDTFLDASAQFTIPVAVATVVRIKQGAALYEIAFLQSLTTMQFLGLLSTVVASGIVLPRKKPRRITLLVLYGLVDFGFYMGLVGYLRTSKQSWTTIQELGRACKSYGLIVPGFVYAQSHHFPHITAADVFKSDGISGDGWIVFGLFFAGVAALVVAVILICLMFAALISQDVRFLCPISLGFTIGTIYCLAQMEHKRNIMKSITGSEFEDNQWGFGQVVSIFLWAPLLIQMVYYFFARLSDDGSEALKTQCPRCQTGHKPVIRHRNTKADIEKGLKSVAKVKNIRKRPVSKAGGDGEREKQQPQVEQDNSGPEKEKTGLSESGDILPALDNPTSSESAV